MILKSQARSDIRSILLFTQEHWGVEQRRRYRSQLTDGMKILTRFPELGEAREEVFPGCRSRRVAEHVVYYRFSAEERRIVVSRVLHARQDPHGVVAP